MAQRTIYSDKHGLYLKCAYSPYDGNPGAFRPGDFIGHSHAWNTSDAGLSAGMRVHARHVEGTCFMRIKMPDGTLRYWGCYRRTEGDFPPGQ